MKKTIIGEIIAIILILGGGFYYLHSAPVRHPASPVTHVSKKKTRPKAPASKQPATHHSARPYNKENKTKKKSATASSASSSSASKSSSASAAQSSSSVSTGTAGQRGAGKMGDHTVNGKTVQSGTLAQIKQQLSSLGYDANAWSPQDMINLYRSVNQNGSKTPAQITKNDVENYLHH